jgi:hypothetical protein
MHEDRFERGQSRHSARSAFSRYSRSASPNQDRQMSPGRSFQPVGEDPKRSPSRSIPAFDSGNPDDAPDTEGRMQGSFSRHPSKAPDAHANQRGRHVDYNSPYRDSPQSGSPHSSGRGGWTGQHR